MTPQQEPKYEARDGRIYNRATGEPIPEDEPVFILRAKDTTAVTTLIDYYITHLKAGNNAHAEAVLARVKDFQRFQARWPQRMKHPDTEPSTRDVVSAQDLDILADDIFPSFGEYVFWLRKPHPMLCGGTPLSAYASPEGRKQLRDILVSLGHGGVV